MSKRVRQKWRPPLALVLGGTLATVLCLPLVGIAYFKLAGNILGWAETAWMIFWMAVVATCVLGFLVWRLVLRPVYALTEHAKAVKAGARDAPVPRHYGTPELSELGQAVIDMGSTLQDREAGLRAYTNHVTHELKSPLTSLIAAAELLEAESAPEDREELIGTVQRAAFAMRDKLEALRHLSAAREPVGRGPAQLSQVVGAVRDEAEIDVTLEGEAQVPMDAGALAAILGHLAQNAAAHGATALRITARGQRITVADDGPGIEDGNRARIFAPFFTTRRHDGGTGMGLTIVQTMLQAVDGQIDLLPSEAGAVFELRF
ncbi:HAMP domain-containing protein [Roseovarius sp. A21]|uniref:histidine kinase n=1 Tax=Roseovarius bejariae TaxID=2576383 RepID=A0A844CTP7_9RHOB|nr:ATP-binding protein [Roseovarius bejariae]MRU15389.1 HAMP domain-containing protein [Roseovarius bejariae]